MEAANFVFGFALDEERECRGERKIVLYGAFGAKHGLGSDAEARFHHRPFRAGPIGAVADDSEQLRAGNNEM